MVKFGLEVRPMQVTTPVKQLLIATISMALMPIAAIAQEYEGCFLVDDAGNVVQLDSICPGPVGADSPDGTAESGLVRVPIKRRDSGIPVIDVTFNGDLTVEMLLDTGASGTLLTQTVANALDLEPTGRGVADTASEANVEFDLAQVDSITVGGIVKQDVTVGIASPALKTGLLGQDFFGDYDLTVKENIIELRER